MFPALAGFLGSPGERHTAQKSRLHGPKKPTSSVSTATIYFLDYVAIETDIATDIAIQTYLYRDIDTVIAKIEARLKKQQQQKLVSAPYSEPSVNICWENLKLKGLLSWLLPLDVAATFSGTQVSNQAGSCDN